MTVPHFSVVYRGKILPGFDTETAKAKLITTFALSEEKAEKILKSGRIVLKKDADEATARKIGTALKRAGLDIVLVRSDPAPPAPESAAAHRDPHRPLPGEMPPADPQPLEAAEKMPAAPPPAPPIRKIPFEFRGTGTAYFKIWIVNIILSFLTLGIYSAWAKVRRKQYFYGSTRLQGASFEYLAKPLKILKGRAIIVTMLLISSALSQLIPIAGPVFSLVFLFALPWIVVRSLSFNARNSSFRNIRFGFSGSVKDAAMVFVLWPALAFLTFGLLFPAAYYRQKKFIVENSSYGTTRFAFTATAKDYYGLYLKALLPAILGLAAIVGAAFLFFPLIPLPGLVLYFYLFAYFSATTTNLIFNSSRLVGHRFSANLKVWDLIVIVATNSVATALTLGLFYPWAKVRAFRYTLENLTLVAAGELDSFIAGEEKQVSAFADEVSDFFDMDFGL
ncbi:MAG: YjgN family protein [Thermodesulfobacteriota bacterium]